MGERSSIQFKGPDGDLSCVVYAQWGSPWLHLLALDFAEKLTKSNPNGRALTPIDRYEGNAVLVKFLAVVLSEGPDIISRILPPDGAYEDSDHLIVPLPFFIEGETAKAKMPMQ